MKTVFLDTSFAILLLFKSDQLHPKILQLAKELGLHKTKLFTTRAVILEIGNSLSKLRYRQAAVARDTFHQAIVSSASSLLLFGLCHAL
jgi:uncharacterized protein